MYIVLKAPAMFLAGMFVDLAFTVFTPLTTDFYLR